MHNLNSWINFKYKQIKPNGLMLRIESVEIEVKSRTSNEEEEQKWN